MAGISTEQLTEWYKGEAASYLALSASVEATIVSLLSLNKVDYVDVSTRVKTFESLLGKITRKNYSSMEEITDILGVRIILYLESDVSKVSTIISEAFEVDPSKSINKSDELMVDQMGYRSDHYICTLGAERLKLSELKPFKDYKFEIQVRTILQHAWAEIEHDRSYKYPGDLPKKYRRRLNLLAGTLELLDREFSSLVEDLDDHEKSILLNPVALSLEEEISSRSVNDLIQGDAGIKNPLRQRKIKSSNVEPELIKFGLHTIGDVKNLITDDYVKAFNKHVVESTTVGFLRSLMMYSDVQKYFSQSYASGWSVMMTSTFNLLLEKYPINSLKKTLEKNNIDYDFLNRE